MAKKTIFDFLEMKERGKKIVKLSVNDYAFARLAEQAGVDMILVGDSLGMTAYGLKGTMPVTMDQMITHCQAVRRGAQGTWIIGDMPFGSYQKSVPDAIDNASRFFKEADADCVKLEGGRIMLSQIKGIVTSGMPVMRHIGITPQSVGLLGGFKAQGNTAETAIALLEDAKAVEKAGAFALILEGTPSEVGKLITDNLKIPVIGAGSGPHCDGQAILASDVLGLFEEFTPKFVKKYANLAEEIRSAFRAFAGDIRDGTFPEPQHCYKMKPRESEKLEEIIRKST